MGCLAMFELGLTTNGGVLKDKARLFLAIRLFTGLFFFFFSVSGAGEAANTLKHIVSVIHSDMGYHVVHQMRQTRGRQREHQRARAPAQGHSLYCAGEDRSVPARRVSAGAATLVTQIVRGEELMT